MPDVNQAGQTLGHTSLHQAVQRCAAIPQIAMPLSAPWTAPALARGHTFGPSKII